MPTGFTFKTTENYFAINPETEVKLSDALKRVYEYMLTFDCTLSKKQIYNEFQLPSDSKVLDKLIAKNVVVKTYDAVKKIGDLTQKTAELTINDSVYESEFCKLSEKQKRDTSDK